MACGSCGKRGHLIGAAVQRAVQGKPIMPLVRGIGRTVRNDVVKISRPALPRLSGKAR